jgi:hypothetical protein
MSTRLVSSDGEARWTFARSLWPLACLTVLLDEDERR